MKWISQPAWYATRKILFKQEYFFQCSQIVSFLSFCHFYRPKLLIMENVRNFLSHENSVVLKQTLRSLIKLGYQVMIKCITTVSTYESQKTYFLFGFSARLVFFSVGIMVSHRAGIVLSWLVQQQDTLCQSFQNLRIVLLRVSPSLSTIKRYTRYSWLVWFLNWGLLIGIINKECVLGHNHVPLFLMCALMNRPYRIWLGAKTPKYKQS